jgi:hypothetical protein
MSCPHEAVGSLLQAPDVAIIHARQLRGIDGFSQGTVEKGALDVKKLNIIIVDGCVDQEQAVGCSRAL